jgi:predicted transcriptional regulator
MRTREFHGEQNMLSAKERVEEIAHKLPPDATYDEIMRELAFERMVESGLADSRSGKVISNDEMRRRIGQWR